MMNPWSLQALWPLLATAVLAWAVCRMVRRAVHATANSESAHDLSLRDGNDYVVGFDASRIWVSSRNGEQACELRWDELTAVYALAIDGMPHGGSSWVLHGSADVIAEVPSNAEGAMALFGAMQLRLDGFDHAAAVDSAGMAHGFRQLWRKHPD